MLQNDWLKLLENKLEMLRTLDPSSAFCLGLTCKRFHGIYRSLKWPPVLFLDPVVVFGPDGSLEVVHLILMLEQWLGGHEDAATRVFETCVEFDIRR